MNLVFRFEQVKKSLNYVYEEHNIEIIQVSTANQ